LKTKGLADTHLFRLAQARHFRLAHHGGIGVSYTFLLYIHILGSTLLFGTGLGTAFHGWMGWPAFIGVLGVFYLMLFKPNFSV
jgi:hypothetical protein